MKRALIVVLIALISLPVLFIIAWRGLPLLGQPTPRPGETNSEIAKVEEAIRIAIEEQDDGLPILLLFDTQISNIQISEDGSWATGWLNPVDRETGQIVPTEPGLAIAKKEAGIWLATLPSDPRWVIMAQSAPVDLLDSQQKAAWMQQASIVTEALSLGTYSGYLLPWAGGETMRLTQSIGHDRYTPSGNAHFAFDFATGNYPSGLFNVHASKSGVVKQARWSQPNGDPGSPGNYIVLEDTSTSPPTYQLYLHLAQDSIPPELRVIGTPVFRSQFLGVADDTGVSTGNHLHFMVHTNAFSYWGTSVDITFDDVSINGGRPRISSDLPYCKSTDVCDVTQSSYVSGNYLSPDHEPPRGSIMFPQLGEVVKSNLPFFSGWAADDESGIASAQFIAKYNGDWHPIEPVFSNSPFSLNWDFCAAQVPDGPVSIALQIRDNINNQTGGLPGLTHFIKNFTCPTSPPACVPTPDQVALFADPDYRGNCVVLNQGSHTSASLGELGMDNAASLQIGGNVWATTFSSDNFQARSETFQTNDSNLGDNLVGANTISSVIVQPRSNIPDPPTPTWPEVAAVYKSSDTFNLVWSDAGGATQFQARMLVGSSEVLTSEWENKNTWQLNGLNAGTYSWQVRARNNAGTGDWSASRSLVIQSSSPPPAGSVNVPFIDTFESIVPNWVNSNYWDLTDQRNHTPGGAISWFYDTSSGQGYDTGLPNSGYLTSPPIPLPSGSPAYLRFWYLYETESPNLHWDQRWVQISVDGGPFTNILQLSDDVPNYWLRSPAVNLQAYAGHSIRIRFYFATLDEKFNNFIGWFIDDFSVTTDPPPNCADNDGNSFLNAPAINYSLTVNGVICPGGDIDYYMFQAQAGDKIGARVDANEIGSELDSYLYLIDADGKSVLAENDDQILYQRTDSFLYYRIMRTGTYYLKIRAWDHPTAGGANFPYSLSLYNDAEPPAGKFIFPVQGKPLPQQPITLSVEAQDLQSGISHVQFLWHSVDWRDADWIVLGEDWDPANGWSFPFDVGAVIDTSTIAFFAKIYDWGGNWIGVGYWNGYFPPFHFPLIFNQ